MIGEAGDDGGNLGDETVRVQGVEARCVGPGVELRQQICQRCGSRQPIQPGRVPRHDPEPLETHELHGHRRAPLSREVRQLGNPKEPFPMTLGLLPQPPLPLERIHDGAPSTHGPTSDRTRSMTASKIIPAPPAVSI